MLFSLSWHSPRSLCRGGPSRSRPCCASTCSSADSRSAAAASSSSPAGTDTRPSRSAAARTPDLSWLVGKARYLTFTAVVSSSHEYFANVSQLAGHEFRRQKCCNRGSTRRIIKRNDCHASIFCSKCYTLMFSGAETRELCGPKKCEKRVNPIVDT